MTKHPRGERDLERARRAGAAAQAQGKSSLEMVLAQIGAAFDRPAAANAFKDRVERYMRLGPSHPAVRARYGGRAPPLRSRNLDAAIVLVERWRRDERKAFQIASAFGRGSRLSLDVLAELRLILRLMRRKRMQNEFAALVAALSDEPMAEAAE